MSSAFLNYYENPFDDPGFDTGDPRWIGAWWIGFALQGILVAIFSFPILLFPRRLPRQRQRAMSNTTNFYQESTSQRIGGLLKALKRLAKNPLYVLFALGTICSIIGGFGYFINLPKYMESQFRMSASHASLFSGPPGIAAVQIFTIVGGIAIWKLKPSARALTGGVAVTELIGVFVYSALMIPSCPELEMTGTTWSREGLLLDNECNIACNCTREIFTPVCGPDGISTYFSACHAGCQSTNMSDSENFFNCSCVHDDTGNYTAASTVHRGYCREEECWAQAILYVSGIVIASAITSIPRVGHTLILFRCVDPADKSVAFGTFEMLLCGLAFMPYPVIYGALVDSACLIWELSCGETGNCWLYDVSMFNHLLHGVSAAFALAATLFYVGVFFLSHRVRDLYEEDDDCEHEKKSHSEKQREKGNSKL